MSYAESLALLNEIDSLLKEHIKSQQAEKNQLYYPDCSDFDREFANLPS